MKSLRDAIAEVVSPLGFIESVHPDQQSTWRAIGFAKADEILAVFGKRLANLPLTQAEREGLLK
jgi:hypothetical protein